MCVVCCGGLVMKFWCILCVISAVYGIVSFKIYNNDERGGDGLVMTKNCNKCVFNGEKTVFFNAVDCSYIQCSLMQECLYVHLCLLSS